ncbi:MAG: Yip1 family protein [Rhodobacteraceae bacterium]|nr:Yip1 family protein [Paracoccaceae bacterium]
MDDRVPSMLKDTLELAYLTIVRPGQGVRIAVRFLNTSPIVRLECLLLIAILGTLATTLTVQLAPAMQDGATELLIASPINLTIIQIATMFIVAGFIFGVGKVFGGTGSFQECLGAIIWLQAMLLIVQLAQLVSVLVFPPITSLVTFGGLGIAFYLVISFIKEIHGFRSGLAVVMGVILTLFLIALTIVAFLPMVGFQPGVGG